MRDVARGAHVCGLRGKNELERPVLYSLWQVTGLDRCLTTAVAGERDEGAMYTVHGPCRVAVDRRNSHRSEDVCFFPRPASVILCSAWYVIFSIRTSFELMGVRAMMPVLAVSTLVGIVLGLLVMLGLALLLESGFSIHW